jgi:hypothetical protein
VAISEEEPTSLIQAKPEAFWRRAMEESCRRSKTMGLGHSQTCPKADVPLGSSGCSM